jgi:hypothetical protein
LRRKDLRVNDVVWWYAGYLWRGLDVDDYTKRKVKVVSLHGSTNAKCVVREFGGYQREVNLAELRI